jgi:hypothetical protein
VTCFFSWFGSTTEGSARGSRNSISSVVSFRAPLATFPLRGCGFFSASPRRPNQARHDWNSRRADRARTVAPQQPIAKTLLVGDLSGSGASEPHLVDGLLRRPGRPDTLRDGLPARLRRAGCPACRADDRAGELRASRSGGASARRWADRPRMAPQRNGLSGVAAGFGKPAIRTGAPAAGGLRHSRSHVAAQPGAPQQPTLSAQGGVQ